MVEAQKPSLYMEKQIHHYCLNLIPEYNTYLLLGHNSSIPDPFLHYLIFENN